MSIFTASGGIGQINWTISDLQTTFTTNDYIRVGICTSEVIDDTTIAPTGILDYISAPLSGLDKSVSGTYNCSAGTYTIYGFAQTNRGKYYSVNDGASVQVIVKAPSTTSFSWTKPKVLGGAWNTTAAEWNALTTFIKQKKPTASFTTVTSGITIFTADIYNEVAKELGLSTVKPGNICTAQMMNDLVTAANAL